MRAGRVPRVRCASGLLCVLLTHCVSDLLCVLCVCQWMPTHADCLGTRATHSRAGEGAQGPGCPWLLKDRRNVTVWWGDEVACL